MPLPLLATFRDLQAMFTAQADLAGLDDVGRHSFRFCK
jgi:hypothetical protein